jgi:surface protein
MVFKNEFYFCSCGLALCPSCQINHRRKKHIVYNYEKKNYWCVKHNENFTSYCPDCKYNLCLKCELKHNENHKIIEFKDILPNKNFLNKVKSMQSKFREYIDRFQEEINKIVKTLHSFLDSLNTYYQINEEIVKNYDLRHRNYFSIKNVSNYNIQKLLYDMNCALEESNIEKKINLILDINIKINTGLDEFYPDKGKNYVTIKYMKCNAPGLTGTMRIFGDKFVEENYDNCYIILNNKEMRLTTRISYVKKDEQDDLLEINLIETKKITSMNCMFKGCKTLFSLYNFSQWDTSCVTDMSCMFSKCTNLKSLPDISKWNTSNVKDIKALFCKCFSLETIPDISRWDISKVKDMSGCFFECTSLLNLSDISKWNTSNVINMEAMFVKCSSLKTLPDISKWDITKVEKKKSYV